MVSVLSDISTDSVENIKQAGDSFASVLENPQEITAEGQVYYLVILFSNVKALSTLLLCMEY